VASRESGCGTRPGRSGEVDRTSLGREDGNQGPRACGVQLIPKSSRIESVPSVASKKGASDAVRSQQSRRRGFGEDGEDVWRRVGGERE
jgi:hypothetical protein